MSYLPFDLNGKVVLVTGGNRGIGFAMAHALAQAGADIVIWGRDGAKNEEAELALREQGIRAKAHDVDVANEPAVVAAMQEIVAVFGRIDAVFASAGIAARARSFAETPTATYRRLLSVNLDGVFFTLREACKHMVERALAGDPGGSLVAVSALVGLEGEEAYAASKGALTGLVKTIAVEHARYGVRANCLLPGWISTDMTQDAQADPAIAARILPRIPSGRWGQPDDLGAIAIYLTSDASAYHTGGEFVIDGGYSIS